MFTNHKTYQLHHQMRFVVRETLFLSCLNPPAQAEQLCRR